MERLGEKIAKRIKQGEVIGETCMRILETEVPREYWRFLYPDPPSQGRKKLTFSLSREVAVYVEAVSGIGTARSPPDTSRSCHISYKGREVFSASLPNIFVCSYKPGGWEQILAYWGKRFEREDTAKEKKRLKEMKMSFRRMDEELARELGISVD